MADLPAAASFTRPRGPRRLGDYSWTANTRQAIPNTVVLRSAIIGNTPGRRRLRDYGWSCNLVSSTLAPSAQDPFIGIAFPATPAQRRARDYGWSVCNLLQSTLAPAQVDPIKPPEFPVPRQPRRAREYGWAVNLLQGTLKPAPETQILRVPVISKPAKRKAFNYGWIGNNTILILGEPLSPVEWDPPSPARRLHDYAWAPSVSGLLFPTPDVTPTPTAPPESTLGGTKSRKKIRGPYSDPTIYEEYIKRCIAEREAPREVPKAVLTEALVSEVEKRYQTQYAERDALLRENQILQRLLDMEKAKRDLIAIKARSRQIEKQLQKIEDDEIAMLLAAFDQFDED